MQLEVYPLDTTMLLITAAVVKEVPTDNTNSLVGATIALVIVTGLLVLATWFYALQTRRIVTETRNTVNEVRRATEIQILPSLITTFNTASEGSLSVYIDMYNNIGRGPAKQIRVRTSIVENINRTVEHDIQLIEPAQSEHYFIDAGYSKPTGAIMSYPARQIGYDEKKIYDYYKQNQTTVVIKLEYRDILENEYHPEDQLIDVTKDIRHSTYRCHVHKLNRCETRDLQGL